MNVTLSIALLALFGFSAQAQTSSQAAPSADAQIKAAVLAAPTDMRDGAAVYGYDRNGKFVMLRKGTNEMICLADDPAQEGLSVSCYHKDLEPFMARGRELRKAGKESKEIFEMREQEAKSGKLKMPKQPTTLFVYTADANNFNAASGEVKDGYLRYVVYIPYATSESTGLPLKPSGPAMPWIMYPGTHGAHIMINPPRD
ncbi:hypothetical protein [Pontibacter anaerobius]|uniref:Uncharacterized protein n=1 Tax=Pontibacter anaerobius TaxID=2993940 RepID=A0ABT3RHK7_9BACT|nr:hypothetical protein [Pontibacter anaerobius]MCX2740863.1 hypothetical protein [Pontibacter anaerobius]